MTDVLIVGAGCMGASTAHHLKAADPSLSVTVLDGDLSLARSSTVRSDGNVRVQFSLPENIAMGRYALEVMESFADDMAVAGVRPEATMRKQGNLFMADAPGEAEAQAGMELQQEMACPVEWLDIDEVARRWASLSSGRLVGGTFGPDDGPVDPTAVTLGYRRSAQHRGAVFEEAEIATLVMADDRVRGVRLVGGEVRSADVVIVCAGAWSTGLLATAGVDIPVEPVMRTVYVVTTDVAKGQVLPSVFLPSGIYVLPEQGDTYLMAWSRPDDPVGFDFTPADRSRFYEVLWPELVEWLPAFDRLEVVRSWAGLYAQNVLDANAILGEWPSVAGLYQATGFSGHGFQQCHAVGRYLAEMVCGIEPFLDLSRLGPGRILTGEPVREHAGRII